MIRCNVISAFRVGVEQLKKLEFLHKSNARVNSKFVLVINIQKLRVKGRIRSYGFLRNFIYTDDGLF